MDILEPQVRQLYRLLGHSENPNGYSDVRCILADGPLLDAAVEAFRKAHGGRDPDTEELKKIKVVDRSIIIGEQSVVDWARRHNERGNCYIGRTARARDGAMLEFRTVTADIDPNRERGTSASEALAATAIAGARALLQAHRGGYLAASGNGALVVYRLPSPVVGDFKAFEGKYKAFEEEMRKALPPGVTLDATFDTPRMVKLLGTMSTKGDRANWRHARFIDFPSVPYQRNDVLERISACTSAPVGARIPTAASLGYKSRSEGVFGLAAFCKAKGFSKEATLAALRADPFGRGNRDDDNQRVIAKVFDEGVICDEATLEYSTGSEKLDEHRKRLFGRRDAKPEMSIGLSVIDHNTWGFRRGEIFTIAARPSIGKTSIAVSIAARVARDGKRVLFFTSEMSTDDTYDRLLQVLSGVSGDKFKTGNFTDDDRERLDKAYGELKGFGDRLAICDSTSPNIAQVHKTAERYQPDLLIYDHIQHIGGEAESGRAKVSQFVRGLKDVARELNCAVLALSQIRRLYRDPKTGKEMRPTLSDLKESGTIEEESGAVMLFSILMDEPNNPVRNIYAELAKNRFGPLAVVGIEFNKYTDSWKDMEVENLA